MALGAIFDFNRMIMSRFLSFLILLCLVFPAAGQRIWITGQLGTSNYQGDLQSKSFTFDQAHAMGSLGLLYDITDRVSARAAVSVGKLSAHDKYGKNAIRNLSFSTNLLEAQLGAQYYLLPLNEHAVTPYVFGGVALYHFNPYTFDSSGAKYYLRPLSTEGQGFLEGKDYYQLTSFAIPFGGGLKLSLSDNVNVGLEVGLRKLFTDYLDDVSTAYVDEFELIANRGEKAAELAYRGDELKDGAPYPAAGTMRASSKKDWYYFSAVTLSVRLPGGTGGSGFGSSRKRAKFGCPVNVH